MSLLDGLDLIEIKLYYKYVKTKNGRRLIILDDDKAEEMLKDEEKMKEIEILETGWRVVNWKEQNEITEASSKKLNSKTGEKEFDFLVYRDSIVKTCLKTWNITEKGASVPVTPEVIDQLPSNIVVDLYVKFEKLISFSEEELGN